MSDVLKDEVAGKKSIYDEASVASSPINVVLPSASMAPAMAVATPDLSTPGSLQSLNTLKLAALFNSSLHSRNSQSQENKIQLSASNLLPPPPLFSVNTEQQNQVTESVFTPSDQQNLAALHNSWTTSMSSLMNSSLYTSSAPNPLLDTTKSPSQRAGSLVPSENKGIKDIFGVSSLGGIGERAGAQVQNLPVKEDSVASDSKRVSRVRSRSNFELDRSCDEKQEETSSSDADGCNLAELPHPPLKKRLLTKEDMIPAKDAPTKAMTHSSNAVPDINVSNGSYLPSRAGSNFDRDTNSTPPPVNEQSIEEEELSSSPRRSSHTTYDDEEELSKGITEQRQHTRKNRELQENQSKLIRRKIERLLLIRHCTKCSVRLSATGYFCPVTSHCEEGKALCAHIKRCKHGDCTYAKCLTTREVLSHYIKCKDSGCNVCGPVRSRDKRRRNQMKDDIEWRHANMLL